MNIIFDGNYLFWSEFSIYTGWNKKNTFQTENDEIQFIQSVAKKLFYTINQLPKGGTVIFCFDSKSWRKGVDIPGGGYKKSREDKSTMDKDTVDKFFNLMDQFGRVLEDVGIIVSKYPGAEGDDLCYLWSDRLYAKGESSIIISGDRDLTQLVRMNHTSEDREPFVLVWNNNSRHNKLFTPRNWRELWLKSDGSDGISIFNFNPTTSLKDDMRRLIRDHQINVEFVDSDEVVMSKILGGDDGDDVPPAWTAMVRNKKNEVKPIRLTGQKPGKVIDDICTKYALSSETLMFKWQDPEFMDHTAGLILRITKDVDDEVLRETVIENMVRNAKLVWLNEEQLPYNLVQGVDQHIEDTFSSNITQKHKWAWKSALAGTRFDATNEAPPAKFDPFLGMPDPDWLK